MSFISYRQLSGLIACPFSTRIDTFVPLHSGPVVLFISESPLSLRTSKHKVELILTLVTEHLNLVTVKGLLTNYKTGVMYFKENDI
jgi:hypothetical protein